MSCSIVYKGKTYSQDEFRDYVNSNLEEFKDSLEPGQNTIKVYQGYNKLDNREFNYFTGTPTEAANYGSKVRQVNLDTSDYLIRKIGNESKYFQEIDDFKAKTGKTFDILDNSPEGLETQKEFFRFLKEKGYKGLDMTGGEDNNYAVSFGHPYFNSPMTTDSAENDLKALYRPIARFTLPDGSLALDVNQLPGKGSIIAEKVKAKYGPLQGLISFDHKVSYTGGRSSYAILRINREELKKRINPKQGNFFDSTIQGLSDAMREASETQAKFEKSINRIGEEADKISKIVNKIGDEGIRTRLRDAIKFVKDPVKQTDVKNFSYLVLETSRALKHYAEVLRSLHKVEGIDEKIATIDGANTLADSFESLKVFLNKEFRYVDDSNEFKSMINDMTKYSDQIHTIYRAEAEELAVQKLGQYLAPDQKIALDKLQQQGKNLSEQREKAVRAGTKPAFIKRIDEKIAENKKDIIRLVPNEETIDETLRGARGDLNWATANLRSTLAMGDPVISGFARKLKEGYNAVRRGLMPVRDAVYNQLTDYKTKLNKSNNQTMAKFYEGLYQLQDISHIDSEGKIASNSIYTLMSPIDEKFYNDDMAFKQKIKDARTEGVNVKEAEKQYRDWLNKYAERRYKDAWYDRYELLTPDAEKARERIFDEMNNLTRQIGDEEMSEDVLKRMHELKYDIKRLASNYNEDGTLKDEKGQKDAASIRAFNKATSEMSTWQITERNRLWFKTILEKKQDQLAQGLISKDDFDKWYRLNTQRVIHPDYYAARKVITDRIADLMSKLPKDEFSGDITKLWTEIFDVARPYRDEDNILDGSDVKQEEKDVIKTDEQKIEDLKRKLIRFSGLNINEEQELNALWNSIESLSPEEIRRFSDLRDKKMGYKSYIGQYLGDAEFKLLMDSFTQLAAMQTWDTTEYYKKVYNDELHKFRQEVDPEYNDNIEDVEQEFQATAPWYKNNHVVHFKKVFNEGQTYYTEVTEPLYIWKDVIPTDPRMIEENAPGFAFRTRVVNDEYLNPNFSTDVKDRMLPKRYSDQGELSPYINKDYEALKNQSLNDTQAKAKWDMLQLLTNIHLESQRELPNFKRLGYALPGLMKEEYDRLLEHGVKGVAEKVKNAFTKTQDEKDLALGDVSQLDLSIIPLKYSTSVKPEDQNFNLAEAILKHKAATEEYKYLESELPLAKVLSASLKTAKEDLPQSTINKVLGWMGLKQFIRQDKQSHRSKTFDEFVRMMFYGENEIPFPQIIPGIDTNKIMSNFLGLSALQIMTINIPAHITNIISGEIQNMIEASAGKYFSWRDYLRAKTIYGANIHKFWADYTREGNQSFWNAIAQYFDVPQGEFMNHIGDKTSFTRLRHAKEQLMMIKFAGEHEIQVSTLIAMMQNYKVELNGTKVPLQDALSYEDGKIKIKAGAKISQTDLDRFQDRVHSVLRALNGAYSKIDKSMAEKSILGKLGFFMRKYFMPMAFRRFESHKYDYEEQDFKEGYYRTAWSMIQDFVKLNSDLVRNWGIYKKTLSPEQMDNLRRTMSELGIIAMITTTIWLMGGWDNDRRLKGRWLYTMLLYHMMRAKSEAETFIPLPGLGVNEYTTLFSSPFAAASTVKTIGRGLSDLSNTMWGALGSTTDAQDARFQRDYSIWKQGDLRIFADLIKLTGVNTNLATPENLVKNFELRQR